MIWAVGGISSMVAAAFAPRITRSLGAGRVMIGGLAVSGISAVMIPLASGATFLSAVLLILAQLGDGFYVIHKPIGGRHFPLNIKRLAFKADSVLTGNSSVCGYRPRVLVVLDLSG